MLSRHGGNSPLFPRECLCFPIHSGRGSLIQRPPFPESVSRSFRFFPGRQGGMNLGGKSGGRLVFYRPGRTLSPAAAEKPFSLNQEINTFRKKNLHRRKQSGTEHITHAWGKHTCGAGSCTANFPAGFSHVYRKNTLLRGRNQNNGRQKVPEEH